MFGVTNNNVAAPITTTVFRAPVAADTVTTYAADLKCSNNTTITTIMSMVYVIASDATKPDGERTDSSDQSAAMFRVGVAEAIIAMVDAPTADPLHPNDEEYLRETIRAQIASAGNWLVNLVSAAKKKPLSLTNVEGFFASLDHTGTNANAVMSFINSIKSFYPDHVMNAAHRGLLAPGLWTTYRLTRVSAGVIMFQLIGNFRDLGITTADDATEQAIIESRDSPWDVTLANNIPDKYKGFASIFLEVAGTPLPDWVQGNRAADRLPAARVRGIKTIMRRYLEVKNDVAGIDAITTVAGFSIPQVTDFW